MEHCGPHFPAQHQERPFDGLEVCSQSGLGSADEVLCGCYSAGVCNMRDGHEREDCGVWRCTQRNHKQWNDAAPCCQAGGGCRCCLDITRKFARFDIVILSLIIVTPFVLLLRRLLRSPAGASGEMAHAIKAQRLHDVVMRARRSSGHVCKLAQMAKNSAWPSKNGSVVDSADCK